MHNAKQKESKIANNVFAIDSKEEIKVGIGRLFPSKKVIKEREAIVSVNNLQVLDLKVGDDIVVFYDLKIMMNMFQSMSGSILPKFFTKGATKDELLDDDKRLEIA